LLSHDVVQIVRAYAVGFDCYPTVAIQKPENMCHASRRMEEVRASEVRATLEDLMYVCILEKFIVLGVDMLPRMDGELRVLHFRCTSNQQPYLTFIHSSRKALVKKGQFPMHAQKHGNEGEVSTLTWYRIHA
jgi:hypothetical protein